jgi:flagellin-like hook-associated protein FlgL
MALSIVSNIPALKAQNSLAVSTDRLNRSLARLSSGLRINEAQDDPAGLAVADQLRADVRLTGQAIRNANDGVSAINIADKALEQIGLSLARLAELAEQSATGTIADSQRTALQSEFASLVSEIDRIAAVTSFNGAQLLSSAANINFQVGTDNNHRDLECGRALWPVGRHVEWRTHSARQDQHGDRQRGRESGPARRDPEPPPDCDLEPAVIPGELRRSRVADP